MSSHRVRIGLLTATSCRTGSLRRGVEGPRSVRRTALVVHPQRRERGRQWGEAIRMFEHILVATDAPDLSRRAVVLAGLIVAITRLRSSCSMRSHGGRLLRPGTLVHSRNPSRPERSLRQASES